MTRQTFEYLFYRTIRRRSKLLDAVSELCAGVPSVFFGALFSVLFVALLTLMDAVTR